MKMRLRGSSWARGWMFGALAVPAAACSFPDINYITYQYSSDAGPDATNADVDVPEEAGGSSGEDSTVLTDDGPPGVDTGAGPDSTTGGPDAQPDGDDGPDTADVVRPPLADGGDGGDGGGGSCACAADAMYPTKVSCGGLLGLLCGSTEGFTGTPGCGQSGQYVICSSNGLVCNSSYDTRVQGCKP